MRAPSFKFVASLFTAGAIVLSLVFCQRGWTVELDPGSTNRVPLLARLAGILELNGIDVLHSRKSQAGQQLPDRPRVSMLSEFPREQVFKQRMQLSNVDLDRWMDEFEQGAIGAIVGIYQLPQAKAPMNAERFRELWGIAESIYWSSTISKEAIPQDANPLVAAAYKAYSSPDSRVFISYTRQDAREAEILRQALEQQGYFVFTYLKGGGNEFNVTAREAGEYFAHAGVRLVLDSQNARQSVV